MSGDLILPTQNWHLAKCYRCDMEVPFRSAEERDKWAAGHSKARGPFDDELHTVWVVDMENDHIIRLEVFRA